MTLNNEKNVAILVTKGGLLDAYPPLNLALAAAAMEAKVTIFFTFDGIKLLLAQSQDDLEAPANAPEMKQMLADKQMPTVPELLQMARESGVNLIACQATLDLLEIPADQLGPSCDVVGAAAFLALTMEPGTTSFTF